MNSYQIYELGYLTYIIFENCNNGLTFISTIHFVKNQSQTNDHDLLLFLGWKSLYLFLKLYQNE